MIRVYFLTILVLVLLGGCSTPEGRKRSVDKRIEAIKEKPMPPVDAIPEFKETQVQRYSAADIRSPFNAPVLSRQANIGQPDQNRQKEELEVFSLDSLKMVGTLHKDNRTWALVAAPNGTIYRVRRGNFLGKNYGKIIQINDQGITLEETVPDGLGNWKKRKVEVSLYAGGQSN